jgi:cytidylate kinase
MTSPTSPQRPIVAIDGPAGAGKSSIARQLARRLEYVYIDSGAMYRALALFALRTGAAWDDGDALASLTETLRFQFVPDGERPRLLVNDEDVSDAIRTAEISRGASEVSRWPGVRSCLVARQQELGAEGGVVMEGRDIGTVVFPQAGVKIYLTATPEERARRRALEMRERGENVEETDVLAEVVARDERDMRREHSPLCQAEDAVEFPTDGLTPEQVLEGLERLVRERAAAQVGG